MYISTDIEIKNPLFIDNKLSKLYACAFQTWKTNYRMGLEYYPNTYREVISYIKTKPDFFYYEKKDEGWRIKSKIKPLIDFIEELFISKSQNDMHKRYLEELFTSYKGTLRNKLNSSEFRNEIVFTNGYNSTSNIINLVGLLASISFSAQVIQESNSFKVKPEERYSTAVNLVKKSFNKIRKNFPSVPEIEMKNYDSSIGHYLSLGNIFIKFEPNFLIELSKISKISEIAHYLIIGTFSTSETLYEYKKSNL